MQSASPGPTSVVTPSAAVNEVEREWAEALGVRRFAQLRELLDELNEVVAQDLRLDTNVAR
jgi:hypothetical protein